MKRLLILLAVLLCCMPLASAMVIYPNTSQSFTSSYLLNSSHWLNQTHTTTTICGAYSAGVYSTYIGTAFQRISDNQWETGVTSFPEPVNHSLISYPMSPAVYDNAGVYGVCSFGSGWYYVMYDIHPYYDNESALPALHADFTGSPLNGTSNLEVTLQDASTNLTEEDATYVWSVSPETGVYWWDADKEGETQVLTFLNTGDYNVSLNVTQGTRTDTETKTSYIHVLNVSGYSMFRIRPLDAISGYPIQGANVSVYDQENATWINQTATTGEVTVSIQSGNTFDTYGSAYGYEDADMLDEIAVNGLLFTFPMYPTTMPNNVSAGNVTLYVTAIDADDSTLRISGATVSVAAPWPTVMSSATNSNGMAQFVVKNNTEIMIAVSKAGYMSANRYINSGTGNGGDAYIEQTVLLERLTVTPTATVTTLPGGGTPTPTVTVDPYPCDADHPENCQRKQTDMANILVQYGPMLVMFFIALTIIGGVKQIGR